MGQYFGDESLSANGDERWSRDGSDEDKTSEDCFKYPGEIEDNDRLQNYCQQFAANESASNEDQQPDLFHRNNPNINFSSSRLQFMYLCKNS